MIRTTVVIPNYNGIKYIENCLKSILSSTVDVKVLVIDNGSTDGSKELVKSSFGHVEMVEMDKNTGFCHACNVGIEKSDTEFVMLLNNDTEIFSDTIEKLERDMDEYPHALSFQAKMVSMSNPDLTDSAGDYYCAFGWAFAIGKDKPSLNYSGKRRIFSGCGGATIYRKSILNSIGFLDENHFAYLEDVDLGYRGNIEGYTNYVDEDAVVLHAGSAFSGSRYNEFKVSLSSKNSIYLIYKNMPFIQIILLLPFLLIGYLIKIVFFLKKGLGRTYVKGMGAGFRLSLSEEGKKHKVKFRVKNLLNYVVLHFVLIVNIFRRLG